MKMALELAERGRGFTAPNPLVGAVIVKDGHVVGEGYHSAAGKAHAEVNALDEADSAAKGATLYVTLEPCNHFGRTPPCTERIVRSGVKRVVVAMKDPNPDVTGGGVGELVRKGLEVQTGICEAEANRLNEIFVKFVRTKRPFVVVKCAATLDGQIATRTGDSKWVTGKEARQFVHRLRHALDAIMVGVGTIDTDNPRLTTRLESMDSRDPVRIILDSNLALPEDAEVLRAKSDSVTVVVTGPEISRDKRARLQESGNRVVESPLKNGRIDLDLLMDRLGAMGITSLLIEGGGRVVASAFEAEIVDKVFFFFAPKILGGNDGVPVCFGRGAERMGGCLCVADVAVNRFGDDILIEGYMDY